MSCPLQNVSISPDQIRSNDAVRDDETTAFYDRLAACWNACQGIPTASLQSGIGYVQMLDGFRHSTTQHSPTFSAAAERNAACVRACHGISTEALNAGIIAKMTSLSGFTLLHDQGNDGAANDHAMRVTAREIAQLSK